MTDNRIERINRAVDYIEENLDQEINFGTISSILLVSIYEFRRIFSYLSGVPVSEYIRNRRLSLAALELVGKNSSVTEIAGKYGYDTPSSFARAFKELHGVSPTEAVKTCATLKLYPRLQFKVTAVQTEAVSFRLEKREGFSVMGYQGTSPFSDTDCCEAIWQGFKLNTEQALEDGGYFAEDAGLFACYHNDADGRFVNCTIGAASSKKPSSTDPFVAIDIPASKWVIFEVGEADNVNAVYDYILYQWLPSSCFVKNTEVCNIEYFPKDSNAFEIRFSIRDKNET